MKVGDFGTSRFLEIAAHGTTVIGSPPYMAPEQFEGRAVFSSDLYSLGVTMYQMLTGELPYDTPAPADLERLRRGELVTPPRMRVPQIPVAIDAVVMRALSGQVSTRYQRAEDFLQDLLSARRGLARRPAHDPRALERRGARDACGAAQTRSGSATPRPDPRCAVSHRRASAPAKSRRAVSAGTAANLCPRARAKCPFCSEGQ